MELGLTQPDQSKQPTHNVARAAKLIGLVTDLYFSFLLVIYYPFSLLGLWLNGSKSGLITLSDLVVRTIPLKLGGAEQLSLSIQDKVLLSSHLLFIALCVLISLKYFSNMMKRFQQGEVFSPYNARQSQLAARWQTGLLVYTMINFAVQVWFIPWRDIPVAHIDNLISQFFMVIFIWLSVWLMSLATQLRIDNDLTI
ncbi:hypothetical protein [Neptunicella sp. SCSIO 80796]|uniref:hypothetical protein n=1 Tax=Neptunicella plasticusilytica TaxID=3117012 RepID=UPI003A4E5C78